MQQSKIHSFLMRWFFFPSLQIQHKQLWFSFLIQKVSGPKRDCKRFFLKIHSKRTIWYLVGYTLWIGEMRQHSGALVSTVSSQREGSELKSGLRPFCAEFAYSLSSSLHAWVFSRHFSWLPQSTNMSFWWIDRSKLTVGVTVNGYLLLC